MFCFSEIVLFQFCFSVFTVKQNAETKQNKSRRGLSLNQKNLAQGGVKLSQHLRHL